VTLGSGAIPVEPDNLTLSLEPRGVTGGQVADQPADSLAQLEREVRGGGAHQLADVVEGDVTPLAESVWMFGLAHFCGTTSSRLSISAWTGTEIAFWSPITQPWL
jgi:hypothetical protein